MSEILVEVCSRGLLPGTAEETVAGSAQALAGGTSPEGTFVIRTGDRVVKVEPTVTDALDVARRLQFALGVPEVFLEPFTPRPLVVRGRVVTVWPYRTPVDPDRPEDVPWAQAGQLLARLHTAPLPHVDAGPLPRQGMPGSVLDALDRLSATAEETLLAVGAPPDGREVVTAAARTLPTWALDRSAAPARGRSAAPTHGDWHLGQLVRTRSPAAPPADRWHLIDICSFGIGDPVWDLARPVMWLLAGVMDPTDWGEFLAAYLGAGGCAVPAGNPWPALDPVARAAAVQAAASALARAGRRGEALDDVGEAFVAACRRIAGGSHG